MTNLPDDVVELSARAIAAERHKTLHGLRGSGHSWREHVDDARAALEAARYGEIREALRLMVESFEHSNNELLGHEEEALKLARALLSTIGEPNSSGDRV